MLSTSEQWRNLCVQRMQLPTDFLCLYRWLFNEALQVKWLIFFTNSRHWAPNLSVDIYGQRDASLLIWGFQGGLVFCYSGFGKKSPHPPPFHQEEPPSWVNLSSRFQFGEKFGSLSHMCCLLRLWQHDDSQPGRGLAASQSQARTMCVCKVSIFLQQAVQRGL